MKKSTELLSKIKRKLLSILNNITGNLLNAQTAYVEIPKKCRNYNKKCSRKA